MKAEYMFGFLKQPYEINGLGFEIKPLQDFDKIVTQILTKETITGRWCYPLPVPSLSGQISLPAVRFELPATHLLVTAMRSPDKEYGEFLILVLGFLLGLRLTIHGAGHLYPTPHEPGTLVSFLPYKHEIPLCLEKTTVFWDTHTPEVRKLMFGAIHWFLASQAFPHQYEKFAFSYMVLDSLHVIAWEAKLGYKTRFNGKKHPKKHPKEHWNVPHNMRPIGLADEFGTPLPISFSENNQQHGSDRLKSLISCRNELIHEARWGGEPLGYAASMKGHQLTADLVYFCSQMILGLLGIDCEFRKHENTWQLQGLDLLP